MAEINPRKIKGVWTDGYALDLHSTKSVFLGHNEFGHPEFETHRTKIGELIYRLKYKTDETALIEIGDVAEMFIRSWGIDTSLIVPVPPTAARSIQPVFQIADEIGARLQVPVAKTAIRKSKQIPELKNIYDFSERRLLLEDAFTVNTSMVERQRILLVDDLYRSGATMSAVAEALRTAGAATIFALALTQTRKRA